MRCCPDTGATQTVVHERVAQRANLKLNKPCIGMNNITGPMDIIGEAEIVLKYDGLGGMTFALVARGMDFTCLIAWHDLQPLQVISNNIPSCISAATSHDRTSSIVADFPSVFKDELGEAPMNVPKMLIHLTEHYIPYRISTDRQVPLRFTTPAEKVVLDLIIARVIAPVTEPTEWCAPAFFVPKSDRKKERIVIDYTKLNKFLKRPSISFGESIPAGTRYFAKMDAMHCYFQLPLDDPSSKITTFLLPSGRFRYLRAPVGISSTSDEWCCHSDRALEGLSFAKKIVDDILVWADDLPTLYDRIRSVCVEVPGLEHLWTKKITIIWHLFLSPEILIFWSTWHWKIGI